MPGPQAPYTHPGPSNYYHQPLVTPYPYPAMNGHSPGPYPYPYPTQHMNGHASMPPSSPRNHPHGRGGYPDASRGGHAPGFHGQNYQHPVPQPPHHHQHPPYIHPGPHVPITHPPHSPQPHPAVNAYPPHPSQKFVPPSHPQQQVPYSPSYVAAQPNGGPYHPSPQNWQSQPLISPLPKQLAMPPPPSLSPLSGQTPRPFIFDGPVDAEPAPSASASSPLSTSEKSEPPIESETTPPDNDDMKPDEHTQDDAQESGPSSPLSSPKESNQPVSPQSVSHSVSSPSSTTSSVLPTGSWAVWSRRPDDPSRAPALIFSPRSCPPDSIVQKAILERTPPQSPVLRPVAPLPPSVEVSRRGTPDILSSSTTDVSTAPDTPMPGSPVSSNTSVSAAAPTNTDATSPKPLPPTIVEEPSVAPAVIDAVVPAVLSLSQSAAPIAEPTVPSPASATVSPEPPVAPPVAPAVRTLTKSWASLLRSNDGASSSKLPVSSVVGFSVPASPPPARIPPVRRTELASLLQGRPIPPTSTPSPIYPRGLVNSGNMCFANSVLQLLVYCQPFWRLFSELGRLLPEGAQGEGETPLVDATVRFLKEFVPEAERNNKDKEMEEEDGLESFMPIYVYEAMKEKKRFDNMRGQHQEDAEEFFGFYLDTLEEELLSLLSTLNPKSTPAAQPKVEERVEESPPEEGWMEVGKKNRTVITRTLKATESPITRVFGGKFRSTLRVPGQRDSVVVEAWRSLQLDIQKDTVNSIQDALHTISQPQSVQVVSPTRPGTTVDASQQVMIEALPPVLVLHLKRFLYDVNAKGVVKISKKISFGPDLEIPTDVIAPAAGKRAGSRHYRLYGVLYHHGISASGGHYTLDILHPNRDLTTSGRPREVWVRFDDELVSDVRPEDVFGEQERDDRCAYLLFYTQIGAGPVGSRT